MRFVRIASRMLLMMIPLWISAACFQQNRFFQALIKCWDDVEIFISYFIIFFGIAVTIVNRRPLREIWHNLLKSRISEFDDAGELWDHPVTGILIPVSLEVQPCWLIEHLKPEYVAFMFTEQSKETAWKLMKKFEGRNIKFFPGESDIEENNALCLKRKDDFKAAQRLAEDLVSWLKQHVPDKTIIADTTGGTVPMSLSIFQVCEKKQISSVYLRGTIPTTKNGQVLYLIEDCKNRKHGQVLTVNSYEDAD